MIKKKSVVNFLNKIRKKQESSFIDSPSRSDYQSPWIDWALREHCLIPFGAIVSERSIVGAIDEVKISNSHPSWKNPVSLRVFPTEIEIIKHLSTMLLSTKQLVIIDQYIQINPNLILDKLLEFISKSKSVEKITIVTSKCNNNPLVGFNYEYSKFDYLPGIKIIKANERFFHDRFIISDCGSFLAGKGLVLGGKEGTPNGKLKWALISKEDSVEELSGTTKAINSGDAIKFEQASRIKIKI